MADKARIIASATVVCATLAATAAAAAPVNYGNLLGTWSLPGTQDTIAFAIGGRVTDTRHPGVTGKTGLPRNGASLSIAYPGGKPGCDLSMLVSKDRTRLLVSVRDARQKATCITGLLTKTP